MGDLLWLGDAAPTMTHEADGTLNEQLAPVGANVPVGAVLHKVLSTSPASREQIRSVVDRAVGEPCGTDRTTEDSG
jgi:hypothetical protein